MIGYLHGNDNGDYSLTGWGWGGFLVTQNWDNSGPLEGKNRLRVCHFGLVSDVFLISTSRNWLYWLVACKFIGEKCEELQKDKHILQSELRLSERESTQYNLRLNYKSKNIGQHLTFVFHLQMYLEYAFWLSRANEIT